MADLLEQARPALIYGIRPSCIGEQLFFRLLHIHENRHFILDRHVLECLTQKSYRVKATRIERNPHGYLSELRGICTIPLPLDKHTDSILQPVSYYSGFHIYFFHSLLSISFTSHSPRHSLLIRLTRSSSSIL